MRWVKNVQSSAPTKHGRRCKVALHNQIINVPVVTDSCQKLTLDVARGNQGPATCIIREHFKQGRANTTGRCTCILVDVPPNHYSLITSDPSLLCRLDSPHPMTVMSTVNADLRTDTQLLCQHNLCRWPLWEYYTRHSVPQAVGIRNSQHRASVKFWPHDRGLSHPVRSDYDT